MVTMFGCEKHAGRLRFAKETLAEPLELTGLGQVGQSDGFDGDRAADLRV